MYLNNALSEKDLLMDLMYSEKQICDLYNNAVILSSCPDLRQIFLKCLHDAQDIQYNLFNAIDQRGWNQVELASEKEIQNVVKKYQGFY